MRRVAAIAILLSGSAVLAAPPDPCSLAPTVTDAKVTIAIPDGRTSFREGEIIPLALSSDEPQFRPKLSQMPRGMKLYFQIWKRGRFRHR